MRRRREALAAGLRIGVATPPLLHAVHCIHQHDGDGRAERRNPNLSVGEQYRELAQCVRADLFDEPNQFADLFARVVRKSVGRQEQTAALVAPEVLGEGARRNRQQRQGPDRPQQAGQQGGAQRLARADNHARHQLGYSPRRAGISHGLLGRRPPPRGRVDRIFKFVGHH